MSQDEINQINALLPEGQRYSRWYRAFEGGIRVISVDDAGREYRYNAWLDENRRVQIERY